jgi:aminopeptidase N
LLAVACLPLVALAACSHSAGVTAIESKSGPIAVEATTPDTAPPDTTSPDTSSPGTTTPGTSGPATSQPATKDLGIGDSLFPDLGNPGIDVEHYTVKLRYDHDTNSLQGNVHLDIAVTEDRSFFSLDCDGPDVTAVNIDGSAAQFDEANPELIITPAKPLSSGDQIGVDVTYHVTPNAVPSVATGQVGWFPTPGGSYVLNEPEGARTWLPSDDHPSDQASFRFEITVPTGVTAVANGAMVEHTTQGSDDTWVWEEDLPMATYLIQVLTGDYELVDGTGPNGLPLLSAVLRQDRERMQPYIDSIPAQIDFFDDWFGPYPLHRYGIAIADSAPGLAMETMERSMFSRDDLAAGQVDAPDEQLLLSHELGHQWFGDAVTLRRWTDVWLNESFATYAQWMWLDHIGAEPIDGSATGALDARSIGSTARPTAADLFTYNSYDGGAVILHALRKTIGDDQFFTLLRKWVADNSGTARTTEDFVHLANEVSGRDLSEFFATWLYADHLPTSFPT